MLKRFLHCGLILLVAACAAPEFTYVKNSGEKTYFKVPHEWEQIATDEIDSDLSALNQDSAAARVRRSLWWSVAYDAADRPAQDHLLTAGPTPAPIVYARVAQLTETQQNAISLDSLRNQFLPVTEDARQAAAATGGLQGFELIHDEVLNPSDGLHGVRVVFDYELAGGVMHTFDQTALVNNDASKLYLLFIRCTTSCYRDRSAEIETITSSFTVRSSS